MWLLRVKKSHPPFVKDGVYLFDDVNIKKVPSSHGEAIPFNEIPIYNNQSNLLLVRSGGIGDLMAYSVLQHVAPSVTIITQDKYRPFLKLWQKPPIFKTPGQPIMMAKSLDYLRTMIKNYGRLSGVEDEIELGSKENWYSIISRSISKDLPHRPQIIQPTGETIKGCLIVSKASVVDRTANHNDIIAAASKYFDNIVLAHEQIWSGQQYIDALMRYEYVISVDTSAIHIREGFGLPALGLYGAFIKECRTSGHQYTTSIQVDNPCTPCHRHSRIPCSINKGTNYAPCLSGQPMIKQIENEIHNYIINRVN